MVLIKVMNDILYRLAVNVPGFLIAIVFHEFAHAYVALRYGDDTAKMSGRLTLDPNAHYDLVGTVIFPAIGIMLGGIMFGWAKPVPVDPRRFKNMKSGIFWVSFAGPLANVLISIILSFLVSFIFIYVPHDAAFFKVGIDMIQKGILINLVIAVFNLIPFPPLDGSKMVSTFLDYEAARKYENLGRYSFLFIIILWTTNIFQYLLMPAIFLSNKVTMLFMQILG